MRYTTSRLARPSELKSKLHCVPPTVNIPYQFFQVDKTACCRASNPFTMNSVLIKFENPTAILTRDMNASCSPTILVTYAYADGYATCNSQHVTRGSRVRSESWAAQPGVWGDNVPPPHFWDQRGTGGTGGRYNENDICFYSRQPLLQVTEFQLP